MPAPVASDSSASTVSQTLPERPAADQLPNKELLLSSAQSMLSLSEEASVCCASTPHPTTNRTHLSSKSTSRLIQNGKPLDVRAYFLLTISLLDITGALSYSRYLYTIRRIRI